jgi:hypothetical protein
MGEKLAADGESGLNISPLPGRDSAQTPPKKTKPVAQTTAKSAPAQGAANGAQRAAKAKPSGGAEAAAVRTDKPAAEKAADGKVAKTAPGKSTPAKGAKVIVGAPSDSPEEPLSKPAALRRWLRASVAVCCSTFVHLALIIALGLWVLPGIIKPEFADLEAAVTTRPDELLNQVLETKIDPSQTLSMTSSAPAAGGAAGGSGFEGIRQPSYDPAVAATGDMPAVSVGELSDFSTPGNHFAMGLPEGTLGEPQAVVGNLQEAMDRITQEILQMLSKGKVIVVWCFDQSESMKDDQKEIRDRIDRVYSELGIAESAQGDALVTAVTSYGENFAVHTSKPTANLEEIRAAISDVPIDPSGKEMMCSAVGQSIQTFHKYATSGRRQMALILVTDESGDEQDNYQNLEPAIQEARKARCQVYALGREAVFGYPYVHMHWTDPSTKIPFWLRIDRGPETPMPEQLQIDGFHRRWDAHPSGFGPYEQVRMAQQTGGVFFMLPSPEVNLVQRDNRKYELEAMRPYLPDLSPRMSYVKERDKSELRSMLWKVITDLNPYQKEAAKYCTVQITFPIDPPTFAKAALENQQKAVTLLQYFTQAQKALDKVKPKRSHEASQRWRANFDLMYAQLLAYKVRIQEYGVYLGEFMKQPKVIKNPHGPTKKTTHWDIRTRKEMLIPDKTKEDREQATILLKEIIKEHPGTPWAARAQWELNRGFGVELIEAFYDPRRSTIKTPNL